MIIKVNRTEGMEVGDRVWVSGDMDISEVKVTSVIDDNHVEVEPVPVDLTTYSSDGVAH